MNNLLSIEISVQKVKKLLSLKKHYNQKQVGQSTKNDK
jgi:hypothetical protein